jgi:hypothetical protein
VPEPVRLTVVANAVAADEIIALLATEGIRAMQGRTDFAVAMADASTSSFGPREILVNPDDLERARELIDSD